jgi:C-terminal processing protease CtpA/Prc
MSQREVSMYKHLAIATVLLGLPVVGPAVRADSPDQQRARQRLHAYLGVRVDTAARGSEKEEGVAIEEVQRNGPAAKAGLRHGDVITQVGRRVVEDFDDLSNAITRHQPGDRVTIHVRRNGKEQNFQVQLSERPGRWEAQADEERDNRRQGGHEEQEGDVQRLERWLQKLDDRLQEQTDPRRRRSEASVGSRNSAYLGVETAKWAPSARQQRDGIAEGGVEVREVAPGSPASDAGLRSGDVITAVNGRDITTPEQLYQIVQRAGSDREITLDVLRGDRHRKIRALLSAGGEDISSLRRLARQIQLMEKRLAQQDRYGLGPRVDDEVSRDLQAIQRQIRQMDERLRTIEQDRKKSPSQDK